MKKKALVLAGYMAFAAPPISIAQALPNNLAGLNLGEIQTSSYLNQPFRGFIPFLFTSFENSSQLNINLASESVFAKIGIEKLPILDDLTFQVALQANKPVILISSNQPIQLPFLNFVLEIEGSKGVVYQDYTVLLDPQKYQENTLETKLDDSQNQQNIDIISNLSNNNLFLATFSSPSLASSSTLKYTVKMGDSLSKIAQRQDRNNVSLKTMTRLIYQKNPKAFIHGDINKIKKGFVLTLPTLEEINGFKYALANDSTIKKVTPSVDKKVPTKETKTVDTKSYQVSKGDSLSKITKKFIAEDVSFTKMMNAIYTSNPDAFSRNNKNLLKTGAILRIPSATDVISKKLETANPVAVNTQTKQTPATLKNLSLSTSGTSTTPQNNQVEKLAELKESEYRVKEGDTLLQIIKNNGFKEASYTKIMKAIYLENPDSFEKNNTTKLKVGSVITLPVSSQVKQTHRKKVPEGLAAEATQRNYVGSFTNKTVSSDNLEKRIRELKAKLDQTKSSLSNLKVILSNKNHIISEKDSELANLKSALVKLKISGSTHNEAQIDTEIKPVDDIIIDSEGTQSRAEIAELTAFALNKIDSSGKNIGFNQKLKNYISTTTNNASTRDLVYISLALILGLVLIRYKRKIYTYTNIDYSQPTYYPTPDIDKYELKEKNINFHDSFITHLDPDYNQYHSTKSVNSDEAYDETSGLIQKDDIHDEVFTELKNQDESEETEHYKHLITELSDDLNTNTATESENTTVDFEKMASDLLQSLNEVERSIKNNEFTSAKLAK